MPACRLVVVLVMASTLVGCGLNAERQEAKDLSDVAAAWNGYHDVNKNGPDNWDQLIAFAKDHPPLNQEALKRVREAGWELKWSLSIRDLLKPEHEPMTLKKGTMSGNLVLNIAVIGTSPSGKRLYQNGVVQ